MKKQNAAPSRALSGTVALKLPPGLSPPANRVFNGKAFALSGPRAFGPLRGGSLSLRGEGEPQKTGHAKRQSPLPPRKEAARRGMPGRTAAPSEAGRKKNREKLTDKHCVFGRKEDIIKKNGEEWGSCRNERKQRLKTGRRAARCRPRNSKVKQPKGANIT